MNIIGMRTGNVPLSSSELDLWVIRTFLKANPRVWVELDIEGIAARHMKNSWLVGKSKDFPATEYDMEVVDGKLFVMYSSVHQ
jgi:hypothetical protein